MPKRYQWTAEVFKDRRQSITTPDKIMKNGEYPVDLELEVEDWLKRNGIPGHAFARIRWVSDGQVHYIVQMHDDGLIEISNTPSARWPMFIPEFDPEADDSIPDDADESDSEDDEGGSDSGDGEGEGEGEMLRRIFGRFFDGKRWRKAAIGDAEQPLQRLRAQFGLIDEEGAEEWGDHSVRARQRQVTVEFSRYEHKPESLVRIRFPVDVEPILDSGSITFHIPADAER